MLTDGPFLFQVRQWDDSIGWSSGRGHLFSGTSHIPDIAVTCNVTDHINWRLETHLHSLKISKQSIPLTQANLTEVIWCVILTTASSLKFADNKCYKKEYLCWLLTPISSHCLWEMAFQVKSLDNMKMTIKLGNSGSHKNALGTKTRTPKGQKEKDRCALQCCESVSYTHLRAHETA